MNRTQRRLGRTPRRDDSETRFRTVKSRNGAEVEEVLPPRSKRESVRPDKPMTNRCCYVSPDQRDFGQLAQSDKPDQYKNQLIEQYGFDPVIPDTINQLRELKKVLCGSTAKVENCSQYVEPYVGYVETTDGSQWQNIDNIDDIDKYIAHEKDGKRVPERSPPLTDTIPRNIYISNVPIVKIIAEKFSRYKKNNIELRKLDEKVVCVEYNIYEQTSADNTEKPVQKMRAFFSIKPDTVEQDRAVHKLPSEVKRNFNISDHDLQKLNEKEVEIIDGKIAENQPYLDDLKKILRRTRIIDTKKNRTSLDLTSLYEMAKRDYMPMDTEFSYTNLLSKAELQEIKDLILTKCTSSAHGISRRTVKCEKEKGELNRDKDMSVISQSIVAELLRDNGKINLFD